MVMAMILDTEGTGLDAPDVVQLAHTAPIVFGELPRDEATVLFFKPRKPISIGAMATHGIIMEDLKTFPEWPGSYALPLGVHYLIGHQIDFDWASIGSPSVKRICTMALAKRYWPDLDSYKLSALIYHLVNPKEAREMVATAHNAAQDIHLTNFVLDSLLHEISVSDPLARVTSWERLWEVSEQARIPLRIGFSKYGPKNGKPGTLYSEVPLGMLRWILDPVRINDMDPWEVKAAQQQIELRG
jgi:exodeoxyribonuclease X